MRVEHRNIVMKVYALFFPCSIFHRNMQLLWLYIVACVRQTLPERDGVIRILISGKVSEVRNGLYQGIDSASRWCSAVWQPHCGVRAAGMLL